jgi:ABC-2 type transport system ATP-binding protein
MTNALVPPALAFAASTGTHGFRLFHAGHHGVRIVVLVLIAVAIIVGVVVLVRRSKARRRSQPDQSGASLASSSGIPARTGAPEGGPPAARRTGARAGGPIVARRLTKRFGEKVAVDDLSFEVRPGRVTGFLGPNGAGKSTTMRMIMGLDAADGGSVTVNGRRYHDLGWPLHEVGALLEAKAAHPGRSAVAHLQMLARSNRIARRRVDEVVDLVGLSSVARQRVGQFSMGMSQRLGIAAALLGDPGVLLFDEPMNGLDTDGIRWVRHLLRSLAAEGRTVFVSSHLMSEMALMADQVVVIGKGRLIADMPMEQFTSRGSQRFVRVRSPELGRLVKALDAAGASAEFQEDGTLAVRGLGEERIGEIALREAVVLHELAPQSASLEEAFIESTEGDTEFRGEHRPPAEAVVKEGSS